MIHVIAAGDFHVNSTVGLCKPTVNLDDGGTYHASRGQRWLWECWLDTVEKVKALEGDKALILNGDLCELDAKKRSTQVITSNKATIQQMTVDALMPMIELCKWVYVVRGTAAHTGKGAWAEEAIANDLDGVMKDKHSASWYHLRLQVANVRFDIAHHASMSGSPFGEKNAANKIASEAAYRYAIELQQPAPNVMLRSHNHRYADSGANFPIFAVCLPAFSLATEYVYRIGKENTLADIGAVDFSCDAGKFTYRAHRYRPETRQIWKAAVLD